MRRFAKFAGIGVIFFFALIGFVFSAVFVGMRFGLFNVRGSSSERDAFFVTGKNASVATSTPDRSCVRDVPTCAWNETREWNVVKGGLEKDAPLIAKVGKETGVSPRLIAAIVVPEQTRFFASEREVFKRYFEPLKILGSLTKFSLGVSGIKQDTALDIEAYANDPASPFYPGPDLAPLLAYPADVDHDQVLYDRLTDAKDHYYAYLYTATFVKEIETQWKRAGFDISGDPAAIVTLFNIGFKHSNPHPDPIAGGAPITTGGSAYPYGELGARFFASNELRDLFPN